MSLKYVVAPNLFLVIWCLASKHARENAKMVNKRERKWTAKMEFQELGGGVWLRYL